MIAAAAPAIRCAPAAGSCASKREVFPANVQCACRCLVWARKWGMMRSRRPTGRSRRYAVRSSRLLAWAAPCINSVTMRQEWHPDKNPHRVEEAQAMFTEIGNAYEILSTQRHQYDRLLRSPFGRGGGGFNPHNFYRPQQHWQQQHWQQQQGGSPLGGLMGMLVPLGILMYMLSSQFNNGGGRPAPRRDGAAKAAEENDAEKEERTPPNRLPKGTRVQVQGLQSATAAALNGTRGGVVRALVQLLACSVGACPLVPATTGLARAPKWNHATI